MYTTAMGEFAKMDIFFFITTIVVILIGIVLMIILIRIWRILGHVEEISKDVSEESALVRDDIAQLRGKIHTEGFKIMYLKTFFTHALKRFAGRSGKRDSSREKSV